MFKNNVRAAAAGIAAVVAIGATSLTGAAAATPATPRVNAPPVTGCAFQTFTGNYVTAVDGGGRTTDVIHTDAPWIRSWEKFTLQIQENGFWAIGTSAIGTSDGHYLTAVGSGGRTTDVIHTDAPWIRSWEMFRLQFTEDGFVAIKTFDGRHYLTAVGGGGRITDTIHSAATTVGSWEKFRLTCFN
jgi:hypothetical protein